MGYPSSGSGGQATTVPIGCLSRMGGGESRWEREKREEREEREKREKAEKEPRENSSPDNVTVSKSVYYAGITDVRVHVEIDPLSEIFTAQADNRTTKTQHRMKVAISPLSKNERKRAILDAVHTVMTKVDATPDQIERQIKRLYQMFDQSC